MVMDATMQPGLNHFVMKGMESMYLPRIPNSILENVSASQTTTVTQLASRFDGRSPPASAIAEP